MKAQKKSKTVFNVKSPFTSRFPYKANKINILSVLFNFCNLSRNILLPKSNRTKKYQVSNLFENALERSQVISIYYIVLKTINLRVPNRFYKLCWYIIKNIEFKANDMLYLNRSTSMWWRKISWVFLGTHFKQLRSSSNYFFRFGRDLKRPSTLETVINNMSWIKETSENLNFLCHHKTQIRIFISNKSFLILC